jgi:hypothetical protein
MNAGVPLAAMTLMASDFPALPSEAMRTALPAVVVAAPGAQAVWSAIFIDASLARSSVVSESSLETVTFQPVLLFVPTLSVEVAKTGFPGVRFGKAEDETTNVRDGAALVVNERHVEEFVNEPAPSGSFADAFHQYWVAADNADCTV